MSKSNILPTVARVLLGLAFFVFGLNGFLNFMPHPAMPDGANRFLGALAGSGYFLPLLKGTETLCGAALLVGAFVPLALTVLAPIIVNIIAFHMFLAPAGLPLPTVLAALEVYLAWAHRDVFAAILAPRPEWPLRRTQADPGVRKLHISHG